ncbi:hypothetical protein [Microbacterium sp. P5_E9]
MTRQDQNYVTDLCDEVLEIPASREHRFDWLRGDPFPKNPRGVMLPVDAYWESLGLVMEFNERQHTESVAHFDKLDVLTVSGVPRGGPDGQRRRYDLRRDELIPAQGFRLLRINMSEFTVRGHHIVHDRGRDFAIVRVALQAVLRRGHVWAEIHKP